MFFIPFIKFHRLSLKDAQQLANFFWPQSQLNTGQVAKPKQSRGIWLKKERFQKELQKKKIDWLPVFGAYFQNVSKEAGLNFSIILECLVGLNLVIFEKHNFFKKKKKGVTTPTTNTYSIYYMSKTVLGSLLLCWKCHTSLTIKEKSPIIL